MNRRGTLFLWTIILLFALAFSGYSIARHMSRQSTTLDLGIQDQVVWNTAHGRPFASSIEVSNYLADHLSLILVAPAPLYWVWPDVRLLLAFQAFALALGAYPVYRLARAALGEERSALLFALVYLLYPALGFINRFDFHALALAVPLLLAGLWAWDSQRPALASLWLILALTCREEVGLTIAAWALGQAIGSRGQERRLAIQWAIIGSVWSLLGMGLVMPHLRGQPSDTFLDCFGHLGPSYGQGLVYLFHHPLDALRASWRDLVAIKATLLPRLLLPLAFLPILAPTLLLPLLPNLAPAVLSRCIPHSTIYYQYMAPVIPFLFLGAIRGFARLERFLSRRWPQRPRRRGPALGPRGFLRLLLVLGTLLASIWDPAWWKPIQGSGWYHVGRPRWPLDRTTLREVRALIPPDLPLATDNTFGPHFSHRQQFYLFPYWESWRADDILVDLETIRRRGFNAAWEFDRLGQLLAYPLCRRWGTLPGGILLIDRGVPLAEQAYLLRPYGVRYWKSDVLLLVRDHPADPALHRQVLQRIAQKRE